MKRALSVWIVVSVIFALLIVFAVYAYSCRQGVTIHTEGNSDVIQAYNGRLMSISRDAYGPLIPYSNETYVSLGRFGSVFVINNITRRDINHDGQIDAVVDGISCVTTCEKFTNTLMNKNGVLFVDYDLSKSDLPVQHLPE